MNSMNRFLMSWLGSQFGCAPGSLPFLRPRARVCKSSTDQLDLQDNPSVKKSLVLITHKCDRTLTLSLSQKRGQALKLRPSKNTNVCKTTFW